MIIDAREGDLQELFIRLREIFETGMKEPLEIMLKTNIDLKKVKTFASMSGCRIEIKDKDEYFIIILTDCCFSCG